MSNTKEDEVTSSPLISPTGLPLKRKRETSARKKQHPHWQSPLVACFGRFL